MTIPDMPPYNKNARQPGGTKVRCYIKAVGPFPPDKFQMEEVVRMGNGRWVKTLRFVVCVLITILVMVLTAPKAC